MRKSRTPEIVGLLGLALAAAIYFIIHVAAGGNSRGEGYRLWALFRDGAGLPEKSRVQSAGISIGQIETRELDPETARAKITVRINPNIKIWSNAVISKKAASLLGEEYLEIDLGTPVDEDAGRPRKLALLKDGDQIEGVREPTPIGEMMAEVGAIVPILNDLVADIRRLTSGSIAEITQNVNQLMAANSEVIDRLLLRVGHIATDIDEVSNATGDDVKVAIQNVREITESLQGLVGASQDEASNTRTAMTASVDRLQQTVDNLDRTLKNAAAIAEGIKKGDGTVGHLVADDTVAQNIAAISEDAGPLVRGVTRLQTIVGMRLDRNIISRSVTGYLQIQVQPRPDSFYLVELVQDSRGFRQASSTASSSSLTGTSSETQVTIKEGVRFSFMFGKRFGPFDGRMGIKESTGGIGADLHLFDDWLNVSLDVFDTRTKQYPRVKPTAALALWKGHVFLLGGGDDVANLTRARTEVVGGIDWFLGARLNFNDQDLKSLLLLGGGK